MIRVLFGLLLLIIACGKSKTSTVANEDILSAEVEYSDEFSVSPNPADIEYEGVYKGTIKGKQIVLEIDEEDFSLTQNGKKIKGKWSRVDDGTTIELEPANGNLQQKYYGWSDENSWIALTDSLTIPEKEEFLKRDK